MNKLIGLLCCFLLVGCSGVSKDEYQQIIKENEYLKTEVTQLKADKEEMDKKDFKGENLKLSGGFIATVREILPDHVFDDKTNRSVVMQLFQSDLFVMNVGEKIASQVKVGETYYFEIEEVKLLYSDYGLTKDQVSQALINLTAYNWIKIKDVRKPNENEGGLENVFIKIESLNKKEEITYEELIKKIKKYDNGITVDDYNEDDELCEHPRGTYEFGNISAEIWSEPHIKNTYKVMVKDSEKEGLIIIYFNEPNFENVKEIFETNGFKKTAE